ncbi:MAG: hypothetical protein HPY55_00160 [Firmicutes bacterium]|nr:hypothetical protein [Bacillota bacterium]
MFGGSLFRASLLGAASGVLGTGLGGLLAAMYREPDRKAFAAMVGFSSGMMLAVTLLDLIPEATRASPLAGLIGTFAGILAMAATDMALPAGGRAEQPHDYPLRPGHRWRPVTRQQRPLARLAGYLQAGIVVGLGIAAHNFAEGLAVGSGYVATVRLGLKIAVLIGLHDVPEGLAMATMLRLGGASQPGVVLAAAAAGLPMALGALVGAMIGEISRAGLALSLGAAGGAMLFITVRLYPEGISLSYGHALVSGTIVGLASGAFLVVAM